MTNIIKHANANKVGLHFNWSEERMQIELSDNGLVSEDKYHNGYGAGIRNMKRRAKQIEADLKIETEFRRWHLNNPQK